MTVESINDLYTSDSALLVRLFLAHLVADFMLQSKRWIISKKEQKWKSLPMYFHAGVVIILTYLFAGRWNNFLIPILLGVSHLITDIWKSYKGESVLHFVTDQFLHILVILIAWFFYIDLSLDFDMVLTGLFNEPRWMIVISAYILVMWPAAFLIAKITHSWQSEIDPELGLKEAGRWIGIWERILTLTFVLIDQISGIGFLITAKSILRFNDLKNSTDRKNAEYILIGTMISISIALITGLLARVLIF